MALTVKDVALRLKLPVETVHRWIRQGKIPMQRRGDSFIIRAEMLERWADEHKLEIQDQSGNDPPKEVVEPTFDSVSLAMKRGGIFYDVQGNDRETVLQSAVRRIPNIAPTECDRIYEKLIERERLASTGIGHGIALPHPRSHPDVAIALPQITTCFLAEAINFGAIDGQPIKVLMVLLSRSTKQHLAMLSKLSYCLRDAVFRDLMLTQPLQPEILKIITALESACD